jgi:hypothetical protein
MTFIQWLADNGVIISPTADPVEQLDRLVAWTPACAADVREIVDVVAYHVGEKFHHLTREQVMSIVLDTLALPDVLELPDVELCSIVVDTIADGLQARDEAHADRYPIGPPMDDVERGNA